MDPLPFPSTHTSIPMAMTSLDQVQLHVWKRDAEHFPISWSGWWAEDRANPFHIVRPGVLPRESLQPWIPLGPSETRSPLVKLMGPDLASLWTCLTVKGPFQQRVSMAVAFVPLRSFELFILETAGGQNYPSVAQVGET